MPKSLILLTSIHLVILSLGLMSCGEDKINEAWGINEPQIITNDNEFKLSAIDSNRVYPHNTVLSFSSEDTGRKLNVYSSCTSISELEEFTFKTITKIRPKLSFIDLIPIDLLISPKNLDFDELKCDFKFSAMNGDAKHDFSMNNIFFKSPNNELIEYLIQFRNLDLFLNKTYKSPSNTQSEFWCLNDEESIFRTESLHELKNYLAEKTQLKPIICRQMKGGSNLTTGPKFLVKRAVHVIARKTKNYMGYKFNTKQSGEKFAFTFAYSTIFNNNNTVSRYSVKKPDANTANLSFVTAHRAIPLLYSSTNYIPYRIRIENNENIKITEDSDSFSFVLKPNQKINFFLSLNLKHPVCENFSYDKLMGDYAYMVRLNESVNIYHSLEHNIDFHKKTLLDKVVLFDMDTTFYLGLHYDHRNTKPQFIKTGLKSQKFRKTTDIKNEQTLLNRCRIPQ